MQKSESAASSSARTPLLFLCHRIPFPPTKGDKIRSFHLLRHLSQHFDIYLAGFIDDPADWSGVDELGDFCREKYFRPLRAGLAKWKSLTGLLTGRALTLPYYADARMQRWVEQTCAARGIQHVLVYSAAMAQFVPCGGEHFERKVIDFVDVDSDKWNQFAEQKPWPLSWLYRREARQLLNFEKEIASEFDASLFVSAAEASLFRQLSPETADKTGHYNNGVDFHYFDPEADSVSAQQNPYPEGCRILVFTGAMDYWPNVDAVTWFANEVLPMLRSRYPELTFFIVGSNPGPNVQRLAKLPGVTVTGRVPDIRPWLKHALAAVAPMRVARGVQNKVLEGMAMALPVLVSRKGLEGIDARHCEHVLLADQPEEYLAAVDGLVGGSFPDIGSQARHRIQQQFDWNQTLPAVVNLLTTETARSARGAGVQQ
ncbi:MAG: TIGR03087 family PEP-CTERM/XrtA system glycosyltransferase [Pseudomonadales bacterium]|nr:TIGR03087 family PEP-CTERM/XrtA system glycosyltransferase [Pseudomonadales bacterium]